MLIDPQKFSELEEQTQKLKAQASQEASPPKEDPNEQNVPAFMMANMVEGLDDVSKIRGVKPFEKRLLRQELTNLDYKEIDIIEKLYNNHFIVKSDPDYELKKRKGLSFNATASSPSVPEQQEQDAADSTTQEHKSRRILQNSQICKSLEQFEKLQQHQTTHTVTFHDSIMPNASSTANQGQYSDSLKEQQQIQYI